jgi:hypothetical protein
MDQMWRNMGVADELAGWSDQLLAGGIPGTSRGEAAYNAARDYELDEQQRVAREQPIVNAASILASIPVFAGRPVMNVPRFSMRQAGTAAAGINAPFALGRQEGDTLQERLPGAAVETAIVGGFGAGLQGLANRFLAPPGANSAAVRAGEFERAGVRPTMAAVAGGAPAGVTRMIAENFIAGAPARARLNASLGDTANAARNLAGRYGQHGQPEQVGETVQRGVQRFARDADAPRPVGRETAAPEAISTREWSFRAKANALYERAFSRIADDEAGHLAGQTGVRASANATRLGRSTWAFSRIADDEAGHLAGQTGVRASANATRGVLQELQARVSAPNVAEIVNDPLLGRISQALADDADSLRFQDLRALRTWVREAQSRPSLTQNIDAAALQRLERALTEDIYRSAMEISGEFAAQQLRRADQFYRAGQNRIQNALQAFDPNRTGGAQAYQRIIALAREGGRQNTRQLQALRNSLRQDEWREVAATVIDDLGRPTAGNPNALEPGAFSVEQFVTNYAKLSPEGRRILFGGAQTDELASALDNLARVAGYQKGVEAMANRSRFGVTAQNFGVGFGLLNSGTTAPTLGVLGAMALTGEMLTNPAFVRWMVSAVKAGGGPGGIRRQLGGLLTLAARDPALLPLYTDLVRRVGENSRAQESPQSAYTEQLQ